MVSGRNGGVVSRRTFAGGLLAGIGLAGASLLGLAGCSDGGQQRVASARSEASKLPSVVIGTMPTEDTLPFYVAADQGLFAQAGIDATVEFFQSAQELSVAVTSGDVQLAMTDPMVSASLWAAGTHITLEWVTLGTDAGQGRFGVQVGPNSTFTSLADLAGVPVGVGSDTVPEYVFDVLMQRAGVPDDQIVGEEIKKLPVRYQMMESGQVAAAALPGSMLALGEANGCRTLADDTTGENISASVMVAGAGFAQSSQGAAALEVLKGVWDQAASAINADPDAYRSVLIANANLSDAVASSYPISTYPTCVRPPADLVTPVLEWMTRKGYLATALTYHEEDGSFSA